MQISRRNTLGLAITCIVGLNSAQTHAENAASSNHTKPSAALVSKSLSITGLVKNKLVFSVDDLKKLPSEIVKSEKMKCLSGADVGEIKDFKGVLLRDILIKADIIAPAHNDVKKIVIIAKATDGYSVVFSWSEVFNNPIGDGIIIYFERDAKPLDIGEGQIAMVSRTDIKSGGRHVKWLKEINVIKVA